MNTPRHLMPDDLSPNDDTHVPLSRNTGSNGCDKVELRGMAPKALVDVFDAVSLARGQDRISLLLEVMNEWAEKRLHEASLINRLTRGNPSLTDGNGRQSGSHTGGQS